LVWINWDRRSLMVSWHGLAQVRKLLLVGYDVRKITGDDISREEYDLQHTQVGLVAA
jgi:hypothetical protein